MRLLIQLVVLFQTVLTVKLLTVAVRNCFKKRSCQSVKGSRPECLRCRRHSNEEIKIVCSQRRHGSE